MLWGVRYEIAILSGKGGVAGGAVVNIASRQEMG